MPARCLPPAVVPQAGPPPVAVHDHRPWRGRRAKSMRAQQRLLLDPGGNDVEKVLEGNAVGKAILHRGRGAHRPRGQGQPSARRRRRPARRSRAASAHAAPRSPAPRARGDQAATRAADHAAQEPSASTRRQSLARESRLGPQHGAHGSSLAEPPAEASVAKSRRRRTSPPPRQHRRSRRRPAGVRPPAGARVAAPAPCRARNGTAWRRLLLRAWKLRGRARPEYPQSSGSIAFSARCSSARHLPGRARERRHWSPRRDTPASVRRRRPRRTALPRRSGRSRLRACPARYARSAPIALPAREVRAVVGEGDPPEAHQRGARFSGFDPAAHRGQAAVPSGTSSWRRLLRGTPKSSSPARRSTRLPPPSARPARPDGVDHFARGLSGGDGVLHHDDFLSGPSSNPRRTRHPSLALGEQPARHPRRGPPRGRRARPQAGATTALARPAKRAFERRPRPPEAGGQRRVHEHAGALDVARGSEGRRRAGRGSRARRRAP